MRNERADAVCHDAVGHVGIAGLHGRGLAPVRGLDGDARVGPLGEGLNSLGSVRSTWSRSACMSLRDVEIELVFPSIARRDFVDFAAVSITGDQRDRL